MNKLSFLLLLAFPLAARASCDPTGSYSRGAPGAHADSFEVRRVDNAYELSLQTYGQKLPDGTWTTGAISGKFELSGHGCAGAYLEPDEECSIFILFSPSGAEAHQFGSCLFGAGAWASGSYRRLRAHGAQHGLTHPSGGTSTASADVNH